jgi:anaerobic selenocysteine-containing dehydrogenase
MPYVPVILYATLGKALPENMASAATLWGVSQFFATKYSKQVAKAGITGKGYVQGNALFQKMLDSDKPIALATFDYNDTWTLMRTKDKKVNLYIEEMAHELEALKNESAEQPNEDYPFILMAGERRSYNANQIFRTPDWRKTDKEGAMRIHPEDLKALGLEDGGKANCRSATSQIEVHLMEDDAVQQGMVTLPHGYGMLYTSQSGEMKQNGPAINELTAVDHCDPIAKTPFHKHVPVAIEAVSS